MEGKRRYSSGNSIVDRVSEISITGNIIPNVWYKTLCMDNGKPYLIAISILADIVYWYRATEVRDENSGELTGYRKKFKADFLQRSYQQICQMFNISKKQAREALKFLADNGVVIQHLRDVITKDGTRLHNVMYLELVPERLYELTYPHLDDRVVPCREPCSDAEGTTVIPFRERGSYPEGRTNTDITTDNSTGDYNNQIDGTDAVEIYRQIIKENIEYENLLQGCSIGEKEYVDEIVDLLTELVAVDREHVLIAGASYPYQVVKGKLLKLNSDHIRYVMGCMKKNTSKVRNIKSYLLSALFNAPNTINHYYQAEVNHDLYGA